VDKVDNTNENWLTIAVRKLKAEGVITRDKQVADMTGYSKEAVSNMLSGRTAISQKFKTKFYETFNLSEDGGANKTSLELAQKLIGQLERELTLAHRVIGNQDKVIKDKDAEIEELKKLRKS
jgi:transcriptional regulator with XRE-family HTH domain